MDAIDFTTLHRLIVFGAVKFIANTHHVSDEDFHPCIGVTRSELHKIIHSWHASSPDDLDEDRLAAVNNTMNAICNGIRVTDKEIYDFTGFHKSEIRKTFDNFKRKYYPNGPYPEDPDDPENEFFNDLK